MFCGSARPGKSAGLDIASRLGLDRGVDRSGAVADEHGRARRFAFLAELHARIDAIEEGAAARSPRRRRQLERGRQSLEQAGKRSTRAKIREVEQRAAELAAEFEQRAQATIGELSQKARDAHREDQARIYGSGGGDCAGTR